MTFSSPPPPPDSGADSEPAAPPTLPGGGSWGDSDIGAAHAAPAMMFAARPAPPADNDKLPTIGHIGRYALKYPIGSGGLGTVYAAQDPLLSRLIAIKTLNVEIPTEERADFNALFLHEARAAAGLSHPHIVTVFDAGISEAGDESRAYIAMELLKGRDLRQLREEGWRPTPAQAALIVRRVADALAYAHSKGVVHRDVKPANIFMVGRTQPRVLDFGIARVAHQHDGAGGAGDIAAGSPYYMSPEQVRQETVDRRSDVFSLGVVLYELLTGRKPFSGANLEQITGAVLNHEPPPAHEVDPALPAALGEITARAMAKDLDKRFRSARAFSRELRHWLDEHPQAGDSAVPVTPPAAGAPLRRRWAMPAALAAGLCAAAALWVALGDREAPATVEARAVPNVAAPPAAAAPVAEPAPAAGPVAAASAVEPSPAVEPAPTAAPPEPAPTLAPAPEIVAAAPMSVAPKPTPAKERRAAREREAKPAPGSVAAPPPTGTLRVAVSPWGEVEVDGRPAGTAPPLTELTLPEGAHRITIRNEDFPPHSTTVNVTAGQAVMVKHRFGS